MIMHPEIVLVVLWLVFAGLHVGLTAGPVRAALVARVGERRFVALFSVLASISFAAGVVYYSAHRMDGAAGPGLASVPVLRPVLIAMTVLGIMLMSAGSTDYAGSPYDFLADGVRPPRGIERVTRHPFFAGLTLFAVAHALLASRLIALILFAGLALLATAGAYHQDRKLLARKGPRYADYLAATSAVPFVAILAGRQRLVARELPLGAIAAGLVIAVVLRSVHDSIFAYGGAGVIAVVVGGAAIITWQSARRAQRVAARAVHPAAPSLAAR